MQKDDYRMMFKASYKACTLSF